MLHHETPFPQRGSFALWRDPDGEANLARIVSRDSNQVLISLPLIVGVAHGNRNVRLAELDEAAPLSPAEQAEYQQLRARRHGVIARGARPRRSTRWEQLSARAADAALLAKLKQKLADQQRALRHSSGQAMGRAA